MPTGPQHSDTKDRYYPDLTGVDFRIADAIRLIFDWIYKFQTPGGDLNVTGNVDIKEIGKGLKIAETPGYPIEGSIGKTVYCISKATMGIVRLQGSSARIYTPEVRADSRIFLTAQEVTCGGVLRVDEIVPGSYFTISADSHVGLSSSIVAWLIIQPHKD